MKFCFQIRHRLWAYCDEGVGLEEQVSIKEHIDSCARCRARAMHISENISAMRQLALLNPPDELWDSIEQGLTSNVGPELSRRVIPRRLSDFANRGILRPAAVLGSLAMILASVFLASRYQPSPDSKKRELDLAGYVNQLSTVACADKKIKEFPAAPGFVSVSLPEARAAVNFPVISPESLPRGYVLTAASLYTCKDFSAVQFRYQGEQGSLSVLQMPPSLNPSFGGLQSERITTGTVYCRRIASPCSSTYGFVLGGTRCVLLIGQTDPSAASELIQAFDDEYRRTQRGR